jgi:DNA polymerase III subunit chi
MPEIEFRTGIADKTGYACRWLRKALQRGAGVHVIGEQADLLLLDRELWEFDERGFWPHALLGAAEPAPALKGRTPVWLGPFERLPALPEKAAPQLLLNLGAAPPLAPQALQAYARVVELVGQDEDDARAGRQRWRAYVDAGWQPQHATEAQQA